MQVVKNFFKRNLGVFIFGLIIALLFLLIIFTQPKDKDTTPPGFKKVEEEIFEREPKQPQEEEKIEYAPQIPSPENVGKPYFYGEHNPNLRDEEGYPKPPEIGSTPIPAWAKKEDIEMIKALEYEVYKERTTPVKISFTKEKGFMPANTNAYTGGKIIWTNNSNQEIEIRQSLPIHKALENGIKLKPGESYVFRPLVSGFFSYAEMNSKIYGTIWVSDVTLPLVQNPE